MRVLVATALAFFAPVQGHFDDRTGTAGITFVLKNSATPEKHLIETMVGGAAVIDFDNDGFPDLFFANGAEQPSLRKTNQSYCNRLYRNRGDWTFEDVTAKAGLCGEGYSIGASAADFDNDGYTDLYVTGVNRSYLYRNRGDGTFEDVTTRAGVANAAKWAVAAGWFDFDNDGRLDLFVVNYVKWNASTEKACGQEKGALRSYCHPRFYDPQPNTLYRNNGDGSFTDVSTASGIAAHPGKGMSVALADYDNDGRLDVFVSNDAVPNFLFHNEGNGTFREVGFPAGVAMNDDGRALSSMGVDFRPTTGPLPDLFITALANETFPFYRNLGRSVFADATYGSRIGAATMALSGWSAGIYDFDNDGYKDLFAACGDVQDNTELYSSRKSRQPNLLLLSNAGKNFSSVEIGSANRHRGAVFADFDRDGRVDAVVTRIGDRPLVLRNNMSPRAHWVALKLIGGRSNRDAIGARVRLVTRAGEQWNHVTRAVGYASSSAVEVYFGIGSESAIGSVEVWWPSGAHSRVTALQIDHYHTLSEPN